MHKRVSFDVNLETFSFIAIFKFKNVQKIERICCVWFKKKLNCFTLFHSFFGNFITYSSIQTKSKTKLEIHGIGEHLKCAIAYRNSVRLPAFILAVAIRRLKIMLFCQTRTCFMKWPSLKVFLRDNS